MDPQDQQELVSCGSGLAPISVREDFVMLHSSRNPTLVPRDLPRSYPVNSAVRGGETPTPPMKWPATQALGGERSPAAARLRSLWIYKDESLLHQSFLIVQGHAVQINKGLRVYKHSHIAELENTVALTRLGVEADVITQSRTSATLSSKTQATLLGRDAFFNHRASNLRDGLFGHLNTLRRGLCRRVFDCRCHMKM